MTRIGYLPAVYTDLERQELLDAEEAWLANSVQESRLHPNAVQETASTVQGRLDT